MSTIGCNRRRRRSCRRVGAGEGGTGVVGFVKVEGVENHVAAVYTVHIHANCKTCMPVLRV